MIAIFMLLRLLHAKEKSDEKIGILSSRKISFFFVFIILNQNCHRVYIGPNLLIEGLTEEKVHKIWRAHLTHKGVLIHDLSELKPNSIRYIARSPLWKTPRMSGQQVLEWCFQESEEKQYPSMTGGYSALNFPVTLVTGSFNHNCSSWVHEKIYGAGIFYKIKGTSLYFAHIPSDYTFSKEDYLENPYPRKAMEMVEFVHGNEITWQNPDYI